MSHLEHVPCCSEQILVEVDSPLDHVFFPDSGVVSVMAVYSDGSTIEMATIGREGCAGVKAVFGTSKSSARYWVQIPGSATKISRAAFTRAVRQMPSFRSLVGLRPGVYRADPGIGSLQWCARSQGATGALAAGDA
jgi:CRP-like cAMP-binding protein